MPTGRLSYRRVSKAALDCALVADDPIECRRSGRRRILLGSGVQNPRARRLAHAKSPAGGGLSVNESALACRYEMRQPGKSLKWFPRGGAKPLGRIVQVRRQTLAEGCEPRQFELPAISSLAAVSGKLPSLFWGTIGADPMKELTVSGEIVQMSLGAVANSWRALSGTAVPRFGS